MRHGRPSAEQEWRWGRLVSWGLLAKSNECRAAERRCCIANRCSRKLRPNGHVQQCSRFASTDAERNSMRHTVTYLSSLFSVTPRTSLLVPAPLSPPQRTCARSAVGMGDTEWVVVLEIELCLLGRFGCFCCRTGRGFLFQTQTVVPDCSRVVSCSYRTFLNLRSTLVMRTPYAGNPSGIFTH